MTDRWEAEIRYEALRDVAREVSRAQLSQLGLDLTPKDWDEIRFSAIDGDALEIWEATWPVKEFDWSEVDGHFKRDTDRFELAIWRGEELCGLSSGRVSNGPDNVTIHFLERMRPDNRLRGKIALIATDVAERYGKILEKQRVKIKDPFVDAIVVYEGLGFVLAQPLGMTTYYARPIG